MSTQATENTVHIWQITAGAEHPRYDSSLTPAELTRAERFHDPRHGSRWRYFHCALREVLAAYTGQAPLSLCFEYTGRDKPVLTDFPALYFNLSHSGDQALLAVTGRAPVGVDIEWRRQLADRPALVRRNFSCREQSQLGELPESQQTEAFYRIWTRKEAVIKANGLGLGIALTAFDVPCLPLQAWTGTRIEGAPADGVSYRLADVPVHEGYSGAIALQFKEQSGGPDPVIECMEYHPENFPS